jgi:hypothetical protein
VAETSPDTPVSSHDLDLDLVAEAQQSYHCTVRELE